MLVLCLQPVIKWSESSYCRFKYSIILELSYQITASAAPHLRPANVTLKIQLWPITLQCFCQNPSSGLEALWARLGRSVISKILLNSKWFDIRYTNSSHRLCEWDLSDGKSVDWIARIAGRCSEWKRFLLSAGCQLSVKSILSRCFCWMSLAQRTGVDCQLRT